MEMKRYKQDDETDRHKTLENPKNPDGKRVWEEMHEIRLGVRSLQRT